MKTMLLTLLTLNFASPAFAVEDCLRCGQMQDLMARMKGVEADPLNSKTVDQQDRLVDTASGIIYQLMNKKQLNLQTARVMLTLTAKIIPYANTGIIGEDNSQTFRKHWADKDGVYRQAVEQLVRENKITEQEKTNMLVELGAIAQAAPKRRNPQSTEKK